MTSGPRSLEEAVARSLDGEPELLPALEELLADLDELGSSPEDVLALLRPLRLPAGTRALELGCGKGVVAVVLARELGLDVTGIDGYAPFVEAARRRAERLGLSARCRFRHADARAELASADSLDLVLMLGLGDLFGDVADTVRALRSAVRPGGYLAIDDCYLAAEGHAPPGYEGYAGHEQTLRRLTRFGDELVGEVVSTPEAESVKNNASTASIRARAGAAKRRWPPLAEAIDRYVARQQRETELLGNQVRCATWLMRRS